LRAPLHDTIESVDESSTISKVLVRNGGGPTSCSPSIGCGEKAEDEEDDNPAAHVTESSSLTLTPFMCTPFSIAYTNAWNKKDRNTRVLSSLLDKKKKKKLVTLGFVASFDIFTGFWWETLEAGVVGEVNGEREWIFMGVDKKLLERRLGDISVGVILFGSLQEVSLPLFHLKLVITKYSRKFSAFVCRWISSMIPSGSELTQPSQPRCSSRTFFILVCLFRGVLGRQLRRLPRRMSSCFKNLCMLSCAFRLYATKNRWQLVFFLSKTNLFCFLLPIFRQTIKNKIQTE